MIVILNYMSLNIKKRKTNSHFIDMLIMDKWNEKEMRENFSEETKNKYKSYIKQIIYQLKYHNLIHKFN